MVGKCSDGELNRERLRAGTRSISRAEDWLARASRWRGVFSEHELKRALLDVSEAQQQLERRILPPDEVAELTTDPNRIIIDATPCFLRLFHYTRRELVGQSIYMPLYRTDARDSGPDIDPFILQPLHSGELLHSQLNAWLYDGYAEQQRVHIELWPQRDGYRDGPPYGLILRFEPLPLYLARINDRFAVLAAGYASWFILDVMSDGKLNNAVRFCKSLLGQLRIID